MLFSSIIFIFIFLPVFLSAYFLSGMRTAVLVTGSAVFYVWGEGAYIVLLLALIALNFVVARMLDRLHGKARVLALTSAIAIDLGVLGLFKYTDFLVANLKMIFPALAMQPPGLKLPLGISFFTFQLLSYLVDVYRRQVASESSLPRFATYILMFPHLIAGPIVRYAEIRGELASRRPALERFGLGMQYFIVGLCQKVLIANILAPVADHAFGLPVAALTAGDAAAGIVAYSLQIYFDFCGYSNMAIGLAFMLGFTFPRNFDYPYAARSITDFWRRWHMSLSFWFRDYVYIPLGGNRGGRVATVRNLLIVFFLTGLWHGAAWRFIVWGLYHGAFLMLERFGLGRVLERAPRLVRHAYAIVVVMVGWVFFRAPDLLHALRYLGAMVNPVYWGAPGVGTRVLLSPEVMAAFACGIVLAWPSLPGSLDRFGVKRIARSPGIREQRLDTAHVHRLPIPVLLLGFLLATALLAGSTLNPFLYFRF